MTQARARFDMKWLACLLLPLLYQVPTASPSTDDLFAHGVTLQQFLSGVESQRDLWLANTSRASVPPELARRFKDAGRDLRVLIVAEDWCVDSANTVPYVAKLGALAAVDVRILNRADGSRLMDAHRTADGRTATPTVVLFHAGQDAGAWIERPAILQQWFRSLAVDPESARKFSQRQSWYDADRGKSALGEIVALAECLAASR